MTNFKDKVFIWDGLLLGVSIIWGTGFLVTKSALDSMTPMYFLSIRFLMSFIIMAAIFFKKIKKVNNTQIKFSLIIGVFLFLGFASQTIGLLYTTPGKQAFITGTSVIMVPFLYWYISKKHPGIHAIIGAFMATLGLGLLSFQWPFYINIGDLLTLACALFFAFHVVFVGKYTQLEDPIILAVFQIGFAGILCLISALIFEPSPSSFEHIAFGPLLYMILASTVVAFLIQNMAQKYTPPTHAAIILCLESVFGFIFSYLLGYDRLTLQIAAGCLLIFISIVITESVNFKKKEKEMGLE